MASIRQGRTPTVRENGAGVAPQPAVASNSVLDRSVVHLLHRAGQRAGDLFAMHRGELDLTPRQYAVLAAAAEQEGTTQTGMVELTGIDRSTLADIVQRLIKKGLLQRRRTREDARAYAVKLTPQGRALLEAAEPVVTRTDELVLSSLSAAEREQFVTWLANMIAACEGKARHRGA
jgi:DNA-binding MarR family transcriptional regulator